MRFTKYPSAPQGAIAWKEATNMNLIDYFGVNVRYQLIAWLDSDFALLIMKKYGLTSPDYGLVILHNVDPAYYSALIAIGKWEHRMFKYASGDFSKAEGDERTFENVLHKLNFVTRTGLPSSEAQSRLDLVEPGDFPFAGAGYYRGYCGGVSAFKEESDWWVFCQIIDKLIELRAGVAVSAVDVCKNRTADSPAGTKYLLAKSA